MDHAHLCPLAKATEILAERWTLLVIRELLSGAKRFNEIRRGVPLMSPSLLARRLRRLEFEGLVSREPSGGGHAYRLTEAGRELAPVIRRLSLWGERWVLGHIDRHRPEATALMWAVRRRVDPSAFGQGRTVVQFELADQPQAKRYWWLINEPSAVDLCLKDLGFDVALYVVTDLETLADIWVGKLQLSTAIGSGRLELSGPARLRRAFSAWLLLSPFAPQQTSGRGDHSATSTAARSAPPTADRNRRP